MIAQYDGDVGVLIEGVLKRTENGEWVVVDEDATHPVESILKSCEGQDVRIICVKIRQIFDSD